ncbi:hypothetical protein AB0L25_17235 [Spirillospora sp. NPDC052242]
MIRPIRVGLTLVGGFFLAVLGAVAYDVLAAHAAHAAGGPEPPPFASAASPDDPSPNPFTDRLEQQQRQLRERIERLQRDFRPQPPSAELPPWTGPSDEPRPNRRSDEPRPPSTEPARPVVQPEDPEGTPGGPDRPAASPGRSEAAGPDDREDDRASSGQRSPGSWRERVGRGPFRPEPWIMSSPRAMRTLWGPTAVAGETVDPLVQRHVYTGAAVLSDGFAGLEPYPVTALRFVQPVGEFTEAYLRERRAQALSRAERRAEQAARNVARARDRGWGTRRAYRQLEQANRNVLKERRKYVEGTCADLRASQERIERLQAARAATRNPVTRHRLTNDLIMAQEARSNLLVAADQLDREPWARGAGWTPGEGDRTTVSGTSGRAGRPSGLAGGPQSTAPRGGPVPGRGGRQGVWPSLEPGRGSGAAPGTARRGPIPGRGGRQGAWPSLDTGRAGGTSTAGSRTGGAQAGGPRTGAIPGRGGRQGAWPSLDPGRGGARPRAGAAPDAGYGWNGEAGPRGTADGGDGGSTPPTRPGPSTGPKAGPSGGAAVPEPSVAAGPGRPVVPGAPPVTAPPADGPHVSGLSGGSAPTTPGGGGGRLAPGGWSTDPVLQLPGLERVQPRLLPRKVGPMVDGYAFTFDVSAMNAQVIAQNYGLQLAAERDQRAKELAELFATDPVAAREFLDEYNARNRDFWSELTWGFGDHEYKGSELRDELAELVRRLYVYPQMKDDESGPPHPFDRPAVYRYKAGTEGEGLDRNLLLRDLKPVAPAPEGTPGEAGPPRSGVRMYGQERYGVGPGERMPHEGWRDDEEPSYGDRDEGHNTIDPDRGGTPPLEDDNMLNEGGGDGPSGPPAGGAPSGGAPAPSGPSGGGGASTPGNAGGPPASGGSGPASDPGAGRLKRLERGPEGRSAPASPSVRV